jgi:hypothetical protein
MTALEALQSVQFVTVKGQRFALVSASDWEAIIDWLETLEDIDTAKRAIAELRTADGDRKQAGWMEWDDVEAGLD